MERIVKCTHFTVVHILHNTNYFKRKFKDMQYTTRHSVSVLKMGMEGKFETWRVN